MSAPALPPIPANIASLTAPIILGEIFSSYLFGMLTVQIYIYHLNFPEDMIHIKAFVYTVFLFEFVSILMTISDMFQWFGSGYGNLIELGNIQLSGVDTPMLGAFVAAAVQLFYCYRIYTINKKAWWISVFVALLALTQVVAGLYGAVIAEEAKTFLAAEGRSKVSVYVLFISAAVTDVLIVMTMTILLLLSGGKKVQPAASKGRSNSRIKKVLNLIVETNLASATVALLTIILFAASPDTNFFTCPSYILPRIYSNSLLLILNNRYYLTIGAGTEPSGGIFKMSKTRNKSTTDFASGSGSGSGGTHSGNTGKPDTRIQVDLETATATDAETLLSQGGSFNYKKI